MECFKKWCSKDLGATVMELNHSDTQQSAHPPEALVLMLCVQQ